MKRSVICHNWQQSHPLIQGIANGIKAWQMAGNGPLVLSVQPQTRSLEANARMWAMLADIAAQVDWYGKKLTPTDWKNVFSASLKKLDVVPNLDGTGFVALGQSTSKMTRGEMADMQTLMEAFGAEHGVKFKAPEGWEDER